MSMILKQITIQNLRNLVAAQISPGERFNVFYGNNGSGKTSLLEAIYCLSLGRSFRTRTHTRLINHDATCFSIFAQLGSLEATHPESIPIGLERQNNGEFRVRIAQENARSLLELARLLPVQLLNTDGRFLLTGTSKVRRQFLDWGVFHVEPTFMTNWQKIQRILKQRNAALKQQAMPSRVKIWDIELAVAAQALHQQRQDYFHAFKPIFLMLCQHFFSDTFSILLEYKPGWDTKNDLAFALSQSWGSDLRSGYTHLGPQRADLILKIGHTPVTDALSQGQQKLIVYALRLAQGILLKQQTQKNCVYLLDDLPAELDPVNRHKVAKALSGMNAQTFITGVERAVLEDFMSFPCAKMFHVEQKKSGAPMIEVSS